MEAEGVRPGGIVGKEMASGRSYPTRCRERMLSPSSIATSQRYLWKYKNI